MNWQEEAAKLPPPTAEEIEAWADGIVFHQTSDGTRLLFNRETGKWQRHTPDSDKGLSAQYREELAKKLRDPD